MISIHKALASLDDVQHSVTIVNPEFQSTRLSRASTVACGAVGRYQAISIHKALASLDIMLNQMFLQNCNFNPQGSREPRLDAQGNVLSGTVFQSTRLSRASTVIGFLDSVFYMEFQSTRLSRASTITVQQAKTLKFKFQSTRLSRASTGYQIPFNVHHTDFNPQGSREPRHWDSPESVEELCISIHKALASLDVPGVVWQGDDASFQSTRLSRASTSLPTSWDCR